MRSRLVEAAVGVLADDGYAAASLSAIVRRARVSRGAQCHHYPSKQALFIDVVEHLAANVRKELRTALIQVMFQHSPEDALHVLWSRLFSTDLFRAYTELAIAGRHEHQIAAALRRTWPTLAAWYHPPVHRPEHDAKG
jgi:AcrR family transcriptional regulator